MGKRLTRPFSVALFVGILAVFLIADRFTKDLAVEHLGDGKVIPFIPKILDFSITYNRGAAFGIFQGATLLLGIIAFTVSIALLLYLLVTSEQPLVLVIAMGLIAAGALGNAIDRVRTGEVIDFIHTLFVTFPTFNVADSCVTIGVVIFLIYLIVGMIVSGKTSPQVEEGVSDSETTQVEDGASDSAAQQTEDAFPSKETLQIEDVAVDSCEDTDSTDA